MGLEMKLSMPHETIPKKHNFVYQRRVQFKTVHSTWIFLRDTPRSAKATLSTVCSCIFEEHALCLYFGGLSPEVEICMLSCYIYNSQRCNFYQRRITGLHPSSWNASDDFIHRSLTIPLILRTIIYVNKLYSKAVKFKLEFVSLCQSFLFLAHGH